MASNGYGHSPDAMDIDGPLPNGTKTVDEWPDAPLDRNEFYRDLQAVHISRGTNLDPNPRVHGKPIDLYDLFYNIEGRGGYDKVSAEKLLWRKIAAEFHLAGGHAAASAFQIKTVYYKNLAAYAIKRVHKQEPPPKEILEDLTAKGSDLLTRTIHNFRGPRKFDNFANGIPPVAAADDDGSESDQRGTPLGDGDAFHSGRALRQAPPQRVFFQPDLSSSRQRQSLAHLVMPQQPLQTASGYSTTNAALNSSGTTFTAAKYETRTFPLSFRPVPTQSNSPEAFQEKMRRTRVVQLASAGRLPAPAPQFIAPGTGFSGPNIYFRSLMGLRSGIREEQGWALSHLVRSSYDRGDTFKLAQYIGAAEGLIEKSLEVASLFYDSKWEISYSKGEELARNNVLDGMDSTGDILERISKLQEQNMDDGLETEAFTQELQLCTAAILVLRNMSMLPENAKYLAEDHIVVKDLLVILLNLPDRIALVEIKNDALDIAEQLTEYWALEADDPLYLTLLKYLAQRDDRGAAMSALRAICRISLQLDETNKLQNIPLDILDTLMQWCMLDDELLVGACLDFFYQYTAIPENVGIMLKASEEKQLDLEAFVHQLARLLLHDAREVRSMRETSPAKTLPPATEILQVPQDLLEQMINIAEPERSSAWLRSCFEEDKESEMTQISLWQAYQTRFQYFSNNTSKPMLAAADFIKRISETFKSANAQVLQNQVPPKFIIKGIRPRRAPVDFKGRPYEPCLWLEPGSKAVCGAWAINPAKLYEHILTQHLAFTQDTNGGWELAKVRKLARENKTRFNCHWSGCRHFAKSKGTDQPMIIGLHIKTHLPDTSEDAEEKARHNSSKRRKTEKGPVYEAVDNHITKPEAAKYQEFTWKNTSSRDLPHGRVEAEGLPLSAVLVLRNLARSIPKAITGARADAETSHWFKLLLKPLMNQLWHVAATNLSLTGNIYDLLETVEKEDGEEPIVQAQI